MNTNDEIIDHCKQIKLHADHVIALASSAPPPIDPPVEPPIEPPVKPPAGVVVMDMDWANPQRLYSKDYGGFGPDTILAVRFTTGSVGTTNSLPGFKAAEYQDPPWARYAVISTLPGDFSQAAKNLYSGPSNSAQVMFAIAPGANAFYGSLQSNTTYYFNIRNEPGGSGNVFVDLVKPGGL